MNPKVDFYFDKAGKWQKETEKLRMIVLDSQLTEDLKWGVPWLEPTIKAYIYEAIEVEKAGLKVLLKKTPEFAMPEELQKKLHELPALKTAFEALTPGRQRAYILYFSAPKQSKTRESRIEKYMQPILDGKGLNDE